MGHTRLVPDADDVDAGVARGGLDRSSACGSDCAEYSQCSGVRLAIIHRRIELLREATGNLPGAGEEGSVPRYATDRDGSSDADPSAFGVSRNEGGCIGAAQASCYQ